MAPPSGAIPDFATRAHQRVPPKTLAGKFAIWCQNRLEAAIAAASRLPDVPVYDTRLFPWVASLEADWRLARAELDEVLKFRDSIPSFHEIIKEVASITDDEQWKTFFLLGIGMDCSENAARCPRSMALLARVPGATTAFFSILAPGKHIPAHRGAYNGVLRLHLALKVPEPASRCRIRVGNEVRCWEEGKALIFDDSFNHEVWNDTDGWRVVLFVDFARPLRQPWRSLNLAILRFAPLAPFLREAGRRQKRWQRDFYRR